MIGRIFDHTVRREARKFDLWQYRHGVPRDREHRPAVARNGLSPLGDHPALAQEFPFGLGSIRAAGSTQQQFPGTCSIRSGHTQIHLLIQDNA